MNSLEDGGWSAGEEQLSASSGDGEDSVDQREADLADDVLGKLLLVEVLGRDLLDHDDLDVVLVASVLGGNIVVCEGEKKSGK